MDFALPNKLTIQWHITNVCNYRCLHCYQDNFQNNDLSIDTLTEFLEKIYQFAINNKLIKIHINFTGGEPFLHPSFLALLRETNLKKVFSFGILSNGYLLNDSELQELKNTNPRFIQISLEGKETLNDEIRGKGSYKQVLKALKTYHILKIPTLISFTANAKNYLQFPEVVKIARKYKAFKVWTDRYLPINPKDELCLNTEQLKELYALISKEQKRNKFYLFSKLQIGDNRALQFLVTGGKPYKCSAGESLLTIMPNGDVFPCRRLPIHIGNMQNDSISTLFHNFEKLKNTQFENKNECKNCYYNSSCNGGLKCLSYAKYGNPFCKDPNCWL